MDLVERERETGQQSMTRGDGSRVYGGRLGGWIAHAAFNAHSSSDYWGLILRFWIAERFIAANLIQYNIPRKSLINNGAQISVNICISLG